MLEQKDLFGSRKSRGTLRCRTSGIPERVAGKAAARCALLAALLGLAACSSPLPDADSRAARLYVQECGTCHVAYPPHMLKVAMWKMQIERMAVIRRQRGLRPTSEADEKTILAYLSKHSG